MKIILYRIYSFLREHEEQCQFFDGFGIIIQIILGIICLSVLLLKRTFEKPQRPFKIWMLDTLKQILGQLIQHVANLLIADKIGAQIGIKCEWYLINIISDAFLGTFFCYLLQVFVLHVVNGTRFDYQSGIYSKEPERTFDEDTNEIEFRLFLIQVFFWFLIVLFSKFFSLILLMIFSKYLDELAKTLLEPIKANPKLKLIFVMILFPIIFNSLQFWITDNIIKSEKIESDFSYFQTPKTDEYKSDEENQKFILEGKENNKNNLEYKINKEYNTHSFTLNSSFYNKKTNCTIASNFTNCKDCKEKLFMSQRNHSMREAKYDNDSLYLINYRNHHICDKTELKFSVMINEKNNKNRMHSKSFCFGENYDKPTISEYN